MLGRGPTKDPSLFIAPFADDPNFSLHGEDYLAILQRLRQYHHQYGLPARVQFIQLRKQAVWFSAGQRESTQFRQQLFQLDTMEKLWQQCEIFFTKKV